MPDPIINLGNPGGTSGGGGGSSGVSISQAGGSVSIDGSGNVIVTPKAGGLAVVDTPIWFRGLSDLSREAIALNWDVNATNGVQTFSPLSVQMNYKATDVADGFTQPYQGLRSAVNTGAGGVAVVGTTVAFTASNVIYGNGHINNEPCTLLCLLRDDTTSGLTSRLWLTDWAVHGPVNRQPQLLGGITLVSNNYYNGSPAAAPNVSYAIGVCSYPGIATSDAAHLAATTYPMDVGIGVVGKSGAPGGPTGRGFTDAFRAGGIGSNWGEPSLFGQAFHGRDYNATGLLLDNPASGNPTGINISGAHGTGIDLSGATFASYAMLFPNGQPIWWLNNAGNGVVNALYVGGGGNWLIVSPPVRMDSDVGFHGTSPIAKPTVTGSKGANAALTSLLTALASYGLVTDSST